MPIIQYNQTTIPYTLIRKPKLKNISIRINQQSEIIVTAPKYIEQTYLDEVLNKKAPWILKQLHSIAQRPVPPTPMLFQTGDTINYLGKPCKLVVHFTNPIENTTTRKPIVSLEREGQTFHLTVSGDVPEAIYQESMREVFKHWFIQHGNNLVAERLELYCPVMAVRPSKVVLKEQKRRWGTCTGKGAIYLNWRLMMAPLSILDYVLVHELAHLKHPNHSKAFWGFVESIVPDYKLQKTWLRNNGSQLSL